MQSLLYYTVSSKEIRIYMPSIPVLLVATSFIRYHQDGTLYLSSLKLPAHIMQRGADWGGYRVATHWCGHPPFTLTQYLYWLVDLQPQWAAMMDLPCLTENGMYPGADEVKRRQDFTTDMAYLIWERCRHLNWSWCITVQGYHLSEYEAHAKELASLIREMQAYYTSPEWRKKGPAFTFRVGIGSLNHGLKTTHVLEIIRVIAEILGQDILFHLWGTKLKFLQLELTRFWRGLKWKK